MMNGTPEESSQHVRISMIEEQSPRLFGRMCTTASSSERSPFTDIACELTNK